MGMTLETREKTGPWKRGLCRAAGERERHEGRGENAPWNQACKQVRPGAKSWKHTQHLQIGGRALHCPGPSLLGGAPRAAAFRAVCVSTCPKWSTHIPSASSPSISHSSSSQFDSLSQFLKLWQVSLAPPLRITCLQYFPGKINSQNTVLSSHWK